MKKILKKTAVFLLVFFILETFCGCALLQRAEGGHGNAVEPPVDFEPNVDLIPDEGNDEGDGSEDDTQNQGPVSPFGPYGEVADEAHQAFYDRAFKMYAWMELGTSTLELNAQDMIEMDGIPYSKVVDPLYDTPDKLQAELASCFSDDICRQITEAVFVERDGFLYAPDVARGSDITVVDSELHLTEETLTSRTYTMVVSKDEDMDGTPDATETYVYKAEKIDGKFKFTAFPFYL